MERPREYSRTKFDPAPPTRWVILVPDGMAFSTRSYARPYLSGDRMPPGVKILLIVNIAVFLLQSVTGGSLGGLEPYLSLRPAYVVPSFFVWRLATYMFL